MTKKRIILLVLGGLLLILVISAVNFVFNPLGLGPERQVVLPDFFFDEPVEGMPALDLLLDADDLFKTILTAIDGAESSIYVQAYIWKDDVIGRKVAKALEAASARGVRVTVNKDALGTLTELVDMLSGRPGPLFAPSGLRKEKNIDVSVDLFADTDHGRYFIVDDQTVILGEMNISDAYHRKRHGYTVRIQSSVWAKAFEKKVLQGASWPVKAPFFIAVNDSKTVEIRTALIEIIDRARHNLIIEHTRFSSDKIIAAVERAVERGVKVNIILPGRPDAHKSANRVTINRLLQSGHGNNPQIFIFPKKMNAGAILVDDAVAAVGTANLSPRCMLTSREVGLFINGKAYHPFISGLRRQLVADMIESKAVHRPYDLDVSTSIKARLEKHIR